MNKRLTIFTVFFLGMYLMHLDGTAQNEVLSNTKVSLAQANPKSLTKFFNEFVEISLGAEKGNYSRTQAEFVMKDFFRRYPPTGFELIHQGASKEGVKYAIGQYTHQKGSFRVYILIKQFKGNYLIDTLNFSEE